MADVRLTLHVRVQKQNGVARAVLLRILQIALGLSFFLMGGLYLGRSFVPRVFTQDPAVISIAERVFPILAAFIVSLPYHIWKHSNSRT